MTRISRIPIVFSSIDKKENVKPTTSKSKPAEIPSPSLESGVSGIPIFRSGSIRKLDRMQYQKNNSGSKTPIKKTNCDQYGKSLLLVKNVFGLWRQQVRREKAIRKLSTIFGYGLIFQAWKQYVGMRRQKWAVSVRSRFFREYWLLRSYLTLWRDKCQEKHLEGQLKTMASSYRNAKIKQTLWFAWKKYISSKDLKRTLKNRADAHYRLGRLGRSFSDWKSVLVRTRQYEAVQSITCESQLLRAMQIWREKIVKHTFNTHAAIKFRQRKFFILWKTMTTESNAEREMSVLAYHYNKGRLVKLLVKICKEFKIKRDQLLSLEASGGFKPKSLIIKYWEFWSNRLSIANSMKHRFSYLSNKKNRSLLKRMMRSQLANQIEPFFHIRIYWRLWKHTFAVILTEKSQRNNLVADRFRQVHILKGSIIRMQRLVIHRQLERDVAYLASLHHERRQLANVIDSFKKFARHRKTKNLMRGKAEFFYHCNLKQCFFFAWQSMKDYVETGREMLTMADSHRCKMVAKNALIRWNGKAKLILKMRANISLAEDYFTRNLKWKVCEAWHSVTKTAQILRNDSAKADLFHRSQSQRKSVRAWHQKLLDERYDSQYESAAVGMMQKFLQKSCLHIWQKSLVKKRELFVNKAETFRGHHLKDTVYQVWNMRTLLQMYERKELEITQKRFETRQIFKFYQIWNTNSFGRINARESLFELFKKGQQSRLLERYIGFWRNELSLQLSAATVKKRHDDIVKRGLFKDWLEAYRSTCRMMAAIQDFQKLCNNHKAKHILSSWRSKRNSLLTDRERIASAHIHHETRIKAKSMNALKQYFVYRKEKKYRAIQLWNEVGGNLVQNRRLHEILFRFFTFWLTNSRRKAVLANLKETMATTMATATAIPPPTCNMMPLIQGHQYDASNPLPIEFSDMEREPIVIDTKSLSDLEGIERQLIQFRTLDDRIASHRNEVERLKQLFPQTDDLTQQHLIDDSVRQRLRFLDREIKTYDSGAVSRSAQIKLLKRRIIFLLRESCNQ